MLQNIPPVTRNLLIANFVVFVLQQLTGGAISSYSLGLHFFLAPDFRIWQLFTYMFLHQNLQHIFFNMFSLWMFGRIVEQAMGSRRFFTYFVVCGIGAGICQEVWQLGQYMVEGLYNYAYITDGVTRLPTEEFLNLWTTIGASGACYGVLLAFGMAYPNERIMLLIPPIPMKAKYFVAGYALIELFSSFSTNSNVAHFAHLGGMLFGFLLIRYWRRHPQRVQRQFGGYQTWTPRQSRTLGERLVDLKNAIVSTFRRQYPGTSRRPAQFKDRDADYRYNAEHRADTAAAPQGEAPQRTPEEEAALNAVLEKIRRNGYGSLTEAEKQLLFKTSRK